jgi:succinoglycan biosynthesis transport protein ExoP
MNSYLLDAPRPVETGFTISDLFKILRRRSRLAYMIAGGIILLTALYCLFATRRYVSVGEVNLQKEGTNGIALGDMTGPPVTSTDALDANISLATQAQILQSDTLALTVIKDLDLDHTPDFQSHFDPIGMVMGLFSSNGPPDPAGAALDDSPRRRTRDLRVFSKHLTVKVVPGTRLIDISYANPDPRLAANVVNHLIQGLMDYTFETKLASTSEASKWLSGQLSDLRKQSEEDQAKLAVVQKQTGMFSFGTDNEGREQVYSDVLDRLQQSTAALSAADSNRILKEAVYKAVRSGNGELISELSGTTATGSGQPVNSSLSLIQNLRLQQATLQSNIATAEQKYGSANPRMTELRASLDQVNKAIQDEITRVSARAKNDYDVAQQTEDQVRQEYETNRKAANDLKDKQVDYTILRDEATQSKGLYDDLLRKLKEAGVTEGLRASNVTVVDPGRAPAKPQKPNIPILLVLSVVAGAVVGFGGALFADALDKRIQTTEEIDKLGLPLVGILPRFGKGRKELDGAALTRTLDAPKSAYSEAVRGLRAVSLIARPTDPPRVILITSASPNEGKSLTARNLAVSLAQQGKRVLLVDADLRRPADQKEFGDFTKEGLSTFLAGSGKISGIVQLDGVVNLFLLPSGPVPANPSELLGSSRMRELLSELKANFDTVLIDSPPVLPVVDAVLLSELADSTLLVARHGVTVRDSLKRSYLILARHVSRSNIGIVLNDVQMRSDAYESYFGQNTSHYYRETVHETL